MKQILLTLIEDTKDIEDFADKGTGYAPILGRKRAINKVLNEVNVVYDDRHVVEKFSPRIMQSPLQIGKTIWVVEGDYIYEYKIMFLGGHSLLTDDEYLNSESIELQYDDYGRKWFSSLEGAMDELSNLWDCDVAEIVKEDEGIWRAPEKEKKEE